MKTTNHLIAYKSYFSSTYLTPIPIKITDEDLFIKSAEHNGFKYGHYAKRLWLKIYNSASEYSPQECYKYANKACQKRYGFILPTTKILPWN